MFFCGGGGGLFVGGCALLVGGGSVCDDLGDVSTGDEVMRTSHPELAHCASPPLPLDCDAVRLFWIYEKDFVIFWAKFKQKGKKDSRTNSET